MEADMKFNITLFYDPEYKGYVVEALELPGCVSQGKTVEEAIENIKDAIKGYVAVESEMGHELPSYETVLLGEVKVG